MKRIRKVGGGGGGGMDGEWKGIVGERGEIEQVTQCFFMIQCRQRRGLPF